MTDRSEAERVGPFWDALWEFAEACTQRKPYTKEVLAVERELLAFGKAQRRKGAIAVMEALSDGQAEKLREALRPDQSDGECPNCTFPLRKTSAPEQPESGA